MKIKIYSKKERYEIIKNKATEAVTLLLKDDVIFDEEIEILCELIKNELKFKNS